MQAVWLYLSLCGLLVLQGDQLDAGMISDGVPSETAEAGAKTSGSEQVLQWLSACAAPFHFVPAPLRSSSLLSSPLCALACLCACALVRG